LVTDVFGQPLIPPSGVKQSCYDEEQVNSPEHGMF